MVEHLLGLCACVFVFDLVIRDNSIPMIMCRFCGGGAAAPGYFIYLLYYRFIWNLKQSRNKYIQLHTLELCLQHIIHRILLKQMFFLIDTEK